jgi:hypothetical protein
MRIPSAAPAKNTPVILLAMLFLLPACPVAAQTYVQSVSENLLAQQATHTLTFAKPNTAPCTLIMSARFITLPPITDSNNNTWVKTPGFNGLWHTTSCASGLNTITVTLPSADWFQGGVAEYSGILIPDLASDFASGSSALATSPVVNARAGELILGSGWSSGSSTLAPSSGYALRFFADAFLEDMIQPIDGPATSSAIYTPAPAYGWYQAVAAFKTIVPLVPQPIHLAVTGSVLFDDKTPAAFGATIILQQQSGTGWVNAGTVASDASGNLSGTFTIDPALVNAGFVTFQFTVSGINAGITQTFLLSMFQQNSTGVNFSLVLFKSATTFKSFSAGLTP